MEKIERADVVNRQDPARPTWTSLCTFHMNASHAGHAGLGVAEWSRRVVLRIRGEARALPVRFPILTEVEAHIMREGLSHLALP